MPVQVPDYVKLLPVWETEPEYAPVVLSTTAVHV
jgi:hypothetical protein